MKIYFPLSLTAAFASLVLRPLLRRLCDLYRQPAVAQAAERIFTNADQSMPRQKTAGIS